MKRKTNLFYNTGQDSKFATFSNYTESLTGNFLSTNTKLFPSVFLCLNVPNLNIETKEDFIKNVLICKYENKLATLRDKLGTNGENLILPLNYLLEYLKEYDENTEITYIGNVTEQDYLGAYTDTICVIDTAKLQNAKINVNEIDPITIVGESKLYGWWDNNEYLGPEIYKNLTPLFDKGNEYIYNSGLNIKINKNTQDVKSCKFNIVVPLFTMVNIRDKFNDLDLEEEFLETTYNRNIPLGMWFADTPIELFSDEYYGQTWSLAIGSQFKPLPTSGEVLSDITKTSNADAFQTFAQVLVRQNQLIDIVKETISNIEEQNKIDNTNPYTDAERAEVAQIPYKQDTLISGQNIKTVNGESLLGKGNVEIKAEFDIYTVINDTVDERQLRNDNVYSNKFTYELISSKEDSLNKKISDNYTELKNDISIIENNVSNINNTVNILDNKIDELETKHDNEISNINNKIETIESNVDYHTTEIFNIDNRVSNNEQEIVSIKINIGELETKHDNEVSIINNTLQTFETSINNNTTQISNIDNRVSENTQEIIIINEKLDNITDISGISNDAIDAIYNDIFEN